MTDWRNSSQAHLLRCHLATFVPLVIQEFLLGRRILVWPRHDPSGLSPSGRSLAQVIAAHGDAILYRVPGQTARTVSALVEALATMAFCPGGVTLAALDLHFEVPPRQAIALLEEQGLLQPLPLPAKTTPVPPREVDPSPSTFEAMFRRRRTGKER